MWARGGPGVESAFSSRTPCIYLCRVPFYSISLSVSVIVPLLDAFGRRRYVHRDVPPLAAAKYVGPRLGVVRAGNGLYWQRGLIRAEKGTQGSPGSNGTSGGSSGDAGGVHHGGCAVVSRCQDNMEGAMPKWVVAVMAAKGAPAYASTLQVTPRAEGFVCTHAAHGESVRVASVAQRTLAHCVCDLSLCGSLLLLLGFVLTFSARRCGSCSKTALCQTPRPRRDGTTRRVKTPQAP